VKKTFCDTCDQQIQEPDERVDFIAGAPATKDQCWQCRLSEIVNQYNERARKLGKPSAMVAFTTVGTTCDGPQWTYTGFPDVADEELDPC